MCRALSSFCIFITVTDFSCKAMVFWRIIHNALYDKDLRILRKSLKKGILERIPFLAFCDPHGARTHDPNIKSVVLYQLS